MSLEFPSSRLGPSALLFQPQLNEERLMIKCMQTLLHELTNQHILLIMTKLCEATMVTLIDMVRYTQEEFAKGMKLAGSEFKEKVKYFTDVWWPAKKLAGEVKEKHVEVMVPFYYTIYVWHVWRCHRQVCGYFKYVLAKSKNVF